jgi:hypothetical protein
MKLILLILVSAFIASCSSVPQPFEPESFKKGLYRKDMRVEANGYKGHGFVVAPKADKYNLRINAMGKLDLFTMTSCHREITQEDAGYKGRFLGFGRNNKLARAEYVPAKGIEDNGSCPLEFGGYEKKRGRHSWGFLIPEHEGVSLPSVVRCNGRDTQYRGVSACQSRAGLIQRIEFPGEMVYQVPKEYKDQETCQYEHIKVIDKKIFEYKMPKGECMLYFQEVADPGRISEHYDYGYTKIMIE